MGLERKKTRKLVFKTPEKNDKWMVCVRFPLDLKLKLRVQAEEEYYGRGKQSQLIEDAVKYYLFTISNINWVDHERDLDYAELIDDINEGLNQKPLGNATQVFFSGPVKKEILELEKKIKLTRPMMRDVRTGLIRKAVSIRLSLGDKEFFDSIMGKEEPLIKKKLNVSKLLV